MYLLPKFQDYPPREVYSIIQYQQYSLTIHGCTYNLISQEPRNQKKGTNSLGLSQALNFIILGWKTFAFFFLGLNFFSGANKTKTSNFGGFSTTNHFQGTKSPQLPDPSSSCFVPMRFAKRFPSATASDASSLP